MRKRIVLGGLVVAALLAMVAIGTYAIFSDNVHSDIQTFGAGTVDIQVDGGDEYFDTELDMEIMEPGDCMTQTVRVTNVGSLDVDLWNWIYTWGPDPARPTTANIFGCDPNPNCNMYVKKTNVLDNTPPEEKLHAGGDFEDWELEACLPLCAGNLCQGGTGQMRMFFHAVQQSHVEGWDCVKLLHKEAPDWIPNPYWTPNASGLPAHGNKCYETGSTNDTIYFVVNGYNMTGDMPLQLMLNGPGGCTDDDKIIAGDFDLNGTVDPGNYDAYYRGFWDGSAMSNTCSGTGEGVYAIAQGGGLGGATSDPGAVTDTAGNFSGQWVAQFADPCGAIGDYSLTTKFLVKQDADPWLEELDELDYQTIEFTCP